MNWLILIPLAEWTIRVVMTLVILRRRQAPMTALAWLTLIFLVPPVGLGAYLLLGVGQLGRRRVQSYSVVSGGARTKDRLARMSIHQQQPVIDPAYRAMMIQAEHVSGNPIVGHNTVEMLAENEVFAARLIEDIDAAEHHVHLLYYIFRTDTVGQPVAEAVERAAKRGVSCRLLADAAGSRPLFRSGWPDRLRAAGARVLPMLPVMPLRRKLARLDLRNHRKIAVIDGHTAYAGSHNVVVDTYGKKVQRWVDLTGRFAGPVVAQLQMVFLDDWAYETDDWLEGDDLFPAPDTSGQMAAQVVPSGPTHEAESFRRVLIAALSSAHRKIIVTTPYLVPDEPTMLALTMAADRGVDVRLVIPAEGDHPLVAAAGRAYFEPLIDGGVRLHRYHGGMLHAKTITVDDSFALLGSANLDIRSFHLNFEVNVLMYGPEITRRLRFAQQHYIDQSEVVDLSRWRARPVLHQYADHAAALLSPLL